MSPLFVGLVTLAILAGLESVRRAFGAGPRSLFAHGLARAREGARLAVCELEEPIERAWPGRGRRGAHAAIAAAVCLVSLGWVVSGLGGSLVMVLFAAVGARGAARALEQRRRRRLGREVPELCERVAATVRAGRSLRVAIARAAEESSGHGASELEVIRRELDLGARLDAALAAACERTPVPELRALSATIEVQQRAGGSLASALDALAGRLRAEERLRADVRAATAQARASAWLVAGLPLAGGVAFELAAPGSATALLGYPLGVGAVLVAGGMYAIGTVTIMRMSGARQ